LHLLAEGLGAEISGKLIFRPNLCYFFIRANNWLREEDRLGDFTRGKKLQNLVGASPARLGAKVR
jgi:hypothetical protein